MRAVKERPETEPERVTPWDWQPFPRECLRCGAPLGSGLGSRCEACGWKESDE